MDTQKQNTHFQDWLGEGSLPLMRGLQLAHKLQAELNGLSLSNLEEANKSSFTRSSLLAVLLDIVSSLNDSIHKLSSTPLQLPLENITPLKKRSHEHVCRKSPNSPRIAKDCKLGPRKIGKRCSTKFQFRLLEVKEGFDDGFPWRKYGQKLIQGKAHPRNYYRCFHKGDLNCPALKQVQECDGIAGRFDIIYIDNHTCKGVCEGPYGTKGYFTAATSSLVGSETSHTNSLASMQIEPSLSISEIELKEEVQDSSISGFATSTRSLLYSLLEHEMLNIPPISPLQVSCKSLERTADNSSKFPQEQQEESTHNDFYLPIWDCTEPFPSFVDFEGQL